MIELFIVDHQIYLNYISSRLEGVLNEKSTIGMRTLNISIVDVSLEVRFMSMRRSRIWCQMSDYKRRSSDEQALPEALLQSIRAFED